MTKDKYDGYPLHKAAATGCIEDVKRLIEEGIGVDEWNKNGSSALHYACEGRNEEVVKLLIEHGADVKKLNKFMLYPMDAAIFGGSGEVVKLLLEAGVEATWNDFEKAVIGNKVEVLKAFIEHGYDVNTKDQMGRTALFRLFEPGVMDKDNPCNFNTIKCLIEHGADVNIVPSNKLNLGNSPLSLAIDFGNREIVDYLLDNGAEVTYKALLNAAFSTDIDFELIGKLIDRCNNSDKDTLLTSVLNAVVRSSNDSFMRRKLVGLLVERGANPHLPSIIKDAIRNCNTQIVIMLISMGVSISSEEALSIIGEQKSRESDPYYGGSYHNFTILEGMFLG